MEITKQQIEEALMAAHHRRNCDAGHDDPPIDYVIGFDRDWGLVEMRVKFQGGQTIVAPVNYKIEAKWVGDEP